MQRTKEGAFTHEHSMNHAVEFFSKAGSLYSKKSHGRTSFYQGESTAKELFINSWITNKPLTMKLLMWLRDCRGGAGNRSGARECFTWLAENDPAWIAENMHLIPYHGRWDDLRSLFNTSLEDDAAEFWANALVPVDGSDPNILAAKWAKTDNRDKAIRNYLSLSRKEYRKLIAGIRKNHIVEHKMCQKIWDRIDYPKVPSVAMARYTNAFKRNDEERFTSYKESLKRGDATVHAGVLFPHDCIRTALNGDIEIAEQQFNALPNYLEGVNGSDERIIIISDTSGSMERKIGGSVNAYHVSIGLALYCSSRIPEESPFYKRFIGFCSEGSFKDWRDMTFAEAIRSRDGYGYSNNKILFDGAVGCTRIDKALMLILNTAIERNIKQALMPTTLLIVSDMQFHQGGAADPKRQLTEVEKCMRKFDEAGYVRPKIVYWNVAGYSGSQATVGDNNVGMISGFSPSILKAVFQGDDFSPYGIMMKAIEKYEIIIPENTV